MRCSVDGRTCPLGPFTIPAPLLVMTCGDGNAASVYLVNIRRYGFATYAHALAINLIAILTKGQSAYNDAFLGSHHCTEICQKMRASYAVHLMLCNKSSAQSLPSC